MARKAAASKKDATANVGFQAKLWLATDKLREQVAILIIATVGLTPIVTSHDKLKTLAEAMGKPLYMIAPTKVWPTYKHLEAKLDCQNNYPNRLRKSSLSSAFTEGQFKKMITVANHLRDHACDLSDASDVDLFGRSAFNRFYYACYWEIRTRLPDIVTDWTKMSHKSLPECLTTSILKGTLKTLDRLRKSKIISDSDFGRLRPRIMRSIPEIAQLLERGYSVRCMADYNPEIKATKTGDSLILAGTKLSTFESSYRDLAKQVGILKKCRNELGL